MATDESTRDPIAVGGSLALLAAVAFGITTPLIKRFGSHAGAFTTAGALYAGAAMASLAGRSKSEAPIRPSHGVRLSSVAVLGAVVAPVCLAWGLQRTGAGAASLLLNFEAVFTVLLARAFFAEPIGRRVAFAVLLMVTGGALLVTTGGANELHAGAWAGGGGAAAVLAASLAWASDNTLTRPLADLDPTRVVLWKATLGATLSLAIAAATREAAPPLADVGALMVCGAIGYGVSLRLYLLAQRRIGAARTGSIFAIAPFVGAAVAWLGGEPRSGWSTITASALFAAAVYLHLTEHHRHAHTHEPLEHEHLHRHDDDHHGHVHGPGEEPGAEHSHWHAHEPHSHSHPHAPDVHHRHRH